MSGDRPATLQYLHQICAAAEDNGFEAVLTPTGSWCEDAWLTTAMLVDAPRRRCARRIEAPQGAAH